MPSITSKGLEAVGWVSKSGRHWTRKKGNSIPDHNCDTLGCTHFCPACLEHFDTAVWHCLACEHHWAPDELKCLNCYRARKSWIGVAARLRRKA